MKQILLSVILLLATVLVACSPLPTSTEPPPTDTLEPTPISPPQTADAVEPGGIEVALTLVTIPDQETVALVNGEEISTAVYQEELERTLYSVTDQYTVDWNDPENLSFLPSLQEQVLDQIIGRVLLRQLADQEGVTVDPEEIEAEIASIQLQMQGDENIIDWDSFLAENNLTEETVRGLIADDMRMEALAERHGGPSAVEHVRASHILVETEEAGQEVLDRLAEGEDFSSLAFEYSIDTGSKELGGDLGWFPQGMMVPEFEDVAFSLDLGETSGLVQSDFGYHIIQVYEKEEREMDPSLYAQVQQQQFQTWLATQQTEANIERLYTFQDSE